MSLTYLSTQSLLSFPRQILGNIPDDTQGQPFIPQKNSDIYLSNLLCPSSHISPAPCLSADSLIPPLPLKNRKWNSFLPPICRCQPFITQKPRFSAKTASPSPNELILQEGRIPSYLSRLGSSFCLESFTPPLLAALPNPLVHKGVA